MKTYMFLATASLGLFLPDFAFAQSDPKSVSEGDIVVTARKRDETLMDVPVVAAVLSADQIQRQQLSTVTDIATKTPGLSLGMGAVDVGTQLSIRGVGQTTSDPGVEQSAVLNLDGLTITNGPAFSVGFFDMAQVEVLKGPQALFFGKNSPAGVVAIRTADPTSDFDAMVRTGYEAEGREWRSEGFLSGPVANNLGVRLAGYYSHFDGYFKNTATPVPALGASSPPSRFGDTKTLMARGTVKFEPTSDFSARLKYTYSRDRQQGGAGFQNVYCPDGVVNYTGVPFFSGNETCRADKFVNIVNANPAFFGGLENGGQPQTNVTQHIGSLEMNYNPSPEITLTSLSGYYRMNTFTEFNVSASGAAASPLFIDRHFYRRDLTEEIRVNSDFSGPLNFSAGGFYQDANSNNLINLAGNSAFGLPARAQSGTHDIRINSLSLFGQLRYKPFEQWEIAVGTRWTNERRTDDPVTTDLFGIVTGTPGATYHVAQPKLRARNWSPELTITYKPSDDLTIFGSLKQGYKSGSFTTTLPATLDFNPATGKFDIPVRGDFGDEKVQGGELGAKARFANRQIFADFAFYYYNYTGLQVGANQTTSGGLDIFKVVNAGSAKVYGIDFSLNYQPNSVPGLTLNAAVNWNHARFTKLDNAPCYGGQTIALGCNRDPSAATPAELAAGFFILDGNGNPVNYRDTDLSGFRLPRAPEWQVNGGANYRTSVGHNLVGRFGADVQFTSAYPAGLLPVRQAFQDAYAKLNANISIGAENDGWELALIGNNLTNKLTTGYCAALNYAGGAVFPGMSTGNNTVGAAGTAEFQCVYGRGRELWARLTLRPSRL